MTPDPIAAIATARGTAALAVVRVSGDGAVAVADRCFGKPLAEAASHTAHVGYFRHPTTEARLDQVVVTVFRAPHSSTGDDVVEITTHGGDLAPALVLDALLAAGARLAEPGEFTQRAFLNGKLDLTQAEAVADLIHASSRQAHKTALAHLRGDYARLLARLRDELLETAALTELELDFSDEDVAFADRSDLADLLARAETTLADLLGSYRFGRLVRDGVRVAILGRPNAGKSTLLNRLVGYDRAIVSPVAGTTRDEVEAEVEVDGLRLVFVDTAGLRDTADQIEAEGVRRAYARAATADVITYVYDVSHGLSEDEHIRLAELRAGTAPVVLVANKVDLAGRVATDAESASTADFALSASNPGDDGPARLAAHLASVAAGQAGATEAAQVVTNVRHRQHLAAALEAVKRARAALTSGLSGDLLALDLRAALHELGAITGQVTSEDVLSAIFSRFCIGK